MELLEEVGGALYLKEFQTLLNKKYNKEIHSKNNKMRAFSYIKTTRDIKKLEKTGYISRYTITAEREVGKGPQNQDIIVLSRSGWYFINKSTRGEVKCESNITRSAIKFKAYKNIILKDELKKSNQIKSVLIRRYKNHQQKFVNKYNQYIDVENILNDDRIIILECDSIVEFYYNIEMKYIAQNLRVNELIETLDKLIAILELIVDMDNRELDKQREDPPELRIKLKCISMNQIRVKKFIYRKDKYTRKYTFYDFIHKGQKPKTFRNQFAKVYKYVEFYTLEHDYNIKLY